jgi:hypothetical protein
MSDAVASSVNNDLEAGFPFEDDACPSVVRTMTYTPKTTSIADEEETEFSFPISRTRTADPHSVPTGVRQRLEEVYDFLKNGNHFNGPKYEEEGIMKYIAQYVRGSSGWTFLHQAAFYQNDEAIECLLKHGANKNIRGRFDGKTPYDVALGNGRAKGSTRVLELLQIKDSPKAHGGAPVRGDRDRSDF